MNEFLFEDSDEQYMLKLRDSVKDKADYSLRQIIDVSKRIKDKVSTGKTNEYGDPIEDWDQVSTRELINFYSEAASWNFYSTPVKMNAFIESSLADIVFKYEFNTILTDPDTKGAVAIKQAQAELSTQEHEFARTYRSLFTSYVTEVLKSFDQYVRRLERIIQFRQQEEKQANPF